MKTHERFAYFCDKGQKKELFGVVTSEHNWGISQNSTVKAARKYLPKQVEEFPLWEVNNQRPLGHIASYALSINFGAIMNYFKTHTLYLEKISNQDDWNDAPAELHLLTCFGEPMTWGKILKSAYVLYAMRKYVEMCVDRPRLYSIGQFHRVLGTVYKQGWYPRTLGFFAPADPSQTSSRLFSDRELYKVEYCTKLDRGIYDLSDLESSLEHNLLGFDKGDYLPDPAIEIFEYSDFAEMVLLSLFHLIQEGIPIKRCANCGNLFVPLSRSDAIYCDRTSPQDSTKTCKAYGSKVLWYENVVSDDVAKLARNIYCAKQMLAKRNPDKREYADMFEFFKTEKKKWEKEIKAGTKTREEYAEWLRKVKLHKTLAELEES